MAIKKCSTLDEIVAQIKSFHRFLHSNSGVYGIKLLRKHDGKRMPFEEIKGLKIKDIDIYNKNTIVIEQAGYGFQLNSKTKHVYSAKLYLENLAVINVYDERAEFFTIEGIDFCYMENGNYTTNIKMLKEWINNDPGIMRSQWVNENSDAQRILDEVGGNRSIKVSVTPVRNFNMKGNL